MLDRVLAELCIVLALSLALLGPERMITLLETGIQYLRSRWW